MRNTLARISGFKISAVMGKYLGVPLLGKCPRKGDFSFLVNKVRDKLSGWKTKHLSFAGRVTLSKSVIQAIPIYSMMTTAIPKTCLQETQRLQRGFIWGDTDEARRMHLINWKTLTLPKQLGGLGIRDLSTMNRACIMKMAWGLKSESNRLWYQVLNGKYGRGTLAAGTIQTKAHDSSLWKAIHGCWQNINSIEAWSLGNGTTINFWRDKWIGDDVRLVDHVQNPSPNIMEWCVSDTVTDSGNWNMDLLNELVPAEILIKLLTHPVPLPHDGPDERYWPGEGSGNFSVSTAYQHLMNFDTALYDDKWQKVWKPQVSE